MAVKVGQCVTVLATINQDRVHQCIVDAVYPDGWFTARGQQMEMYARRIGGEGIDWVRGWKSHSALALAAQAALEGAR